jgi:diacylglycerol O-acyltransferase / wax synthase
MLEERGEVQLDRLTPEDQLMLWPDATWPQDIGALAILEGGDLFEAGGRFQIEAVQEALTARVHRAPRFRQILQVPPRRLGAPVWVDAPDFDIAEHVRVKPLPWPGGESQLLRTVEQLRQRRLDRSRPLGRCGFLPGSGTGTSDCT